MLWSLTGTKHHEPLEILHHYFEGISRQRILQQLLAGKYIGSRYGADSEEGVGLLEGYLRPQLDAATL